MKSGLWMPPTVKKGNRQRVDLAGMPANYVLSVLAYGVRSFDVPQIIAVPGVCIVAMTRRTDLVNVRIRCETVGSDPEGIFFTDQQSRLWRQYGTDEADCTFKWGEILLGEIALAPAGEDPNDNEWIQTQTILVLPKQGKWMLMEEKIMTAIGTVVWDANIRHLTDQDHVAPSS